MKQKLLALCVIIALFFSLGIVSSNKAYSLEPHVYILLVFSAPSDSGSNIFAKVVQASQDKILRSFTTGALYRSLAPSLAEMIVLKDNSADAQTILDKCSELSQKAGPNDAVFVYILSPGASVIGRDGYYRHILFPRGSVRRMLDDEDYVSYSGLPRGDVMKAIVGDGDHRLDVLITDASAVLRDGRGYDGQGLSLSLDESETDASQNRILRYRANDNILGKRAEEQNVLSRFLLNASGRLNINSARHAHIEPEKKPAGEYVTFELNYHFESGEDCFGMVLSDDRYTGTVFTNAFLSCAERDNIQNVESTELFFSMLKDELNERYELTRDYLKSIGDIGIVDLFCQGNQTLTQFNTSDGDDFSYSSGDLSEGPFERPKPTPNPLPDALPLEEESASDGDNSSFSAW